MKAIATTYHGPTNTKGSRIVAKDSDGNRESVTYLPELNSDQNHMMAVKTLCAKMDWHGTLIAGSINPDSLVWVWTYPATTVTIA